ncbi:hypothetical protein [Ramlibacter montanisoli]|uniref:AAA+ ATPase domain-containing protein n=1 Tax=Ramlibacter montanisoli TaxID=2732512 RepID=A0A849K9J3_9BURK|nr:hypothetical protein [Ramlibacter montanisoli]NNU43104.1 hypothetical protein [Ramlibacter montanisoli]
MIQKKKLEDVFKTVGLPPYTYVKPPYYGEVRADISQPGKHLLIEGPSGIGKTCVVFKAFEELAYQANRDFVYLSCRDQGAAQVIDGFLAAASHGAPTGVPILVVDDFHLLPTTRRAEIGSQLKRLSDRAFEFELPPKAILIGIPTTGVSLLSDSYDLGPRLGTYVLKRVSDVEIDKLLSEGETALEVLFEDRDILLSESAGNFWLAQYICNKVCASQGVFETQEEPRILTFDILGIRNRLMTELSQRYMPVAKIFAKGKKWRPGGNKPYLEILLALCKIPESVVTFDKLLYVLPEKRKPGIKAVRPRISEVILDPLKHVDLRKHIAFDPDAGFSIEDPLFRYFLNNLDPKRIYQELGVEDALVEQANLYSYDIGFSFAGEVRRLVEVANAELKKEDVVTFYDFDQQAVLLALDLEKVLERIYSESCRYYLVFLDKHYREKVWTKYEKDVMTRPGRKDHIIPVIVDDAGAEGAVGIPKTIGRIDVRDLWGRSNARGSSHKIPSMRSGIDACCP